MAEHQIVDLAVEGSNPSSHPLSTQFVYTEWVDDRRIVWDAANRRHLGSDHPERHISIAEIEESLRDGDRIETEVAYRQAHQVIGRTSAGRWLVGIWIDDRDGRYPRHAREASGGIIRRGSKGRRKQPGNNSITHSQNYETGLVGGRGL